MWQMVSGPQGSVVTVRKLDTDISGLNVSTVYQDRTPASSGSPEQCTGDGVAYGSNGVNVASPTASVPNTDPTLSATPNSFLTQRWRYFAAPSTSAADAAKFEQQALNPLHTSVAG